MKWFSDMPTGERMSALKNVAAMMAADGEITKEEKAFLKYICERLKLTLDDVNTILRDPASVDFVVPSDPKERANQLVDAVFMMIIDGNIDPREMNLCLKLATVLGFDPAVVPKVIAAVVEAIQQGQGRSQVASLTNNLLKGGGS